MDPTGTGEWLDCVSLPDISLPNGWASDAYVGLTAATGQLSGKKDFIRELMSIFKLQNTMNDPIIRQFTFYFIL